MHSKNFVTNRKNTDRWLVDSFRGKIEFETASFRIQIHLFQRKKRKEKQLYIQAIYMHM